MLYILISFILYCLISVFSVFYKKKVRSRAKKRHKPKPIPAFLPVITRKKDKR